ncbi:MAG: hypothetical protein QN193_01110 [Armatimonadota bacterium]|nr:hypothetical protein [Armatimonadota bacterium]MDR7444689.1 hypothetical protein [Armatimonadota bacterium]MDR7569189.1 hypothetical protein [Armatimonadota bacterium]MDR7613307.1 hypothetical protein [Armatimonadota bacterium]
MQRDLWGNPVIRRQTYHLFHDESIPNKRWFLVGLLFVRDADLEKVQATLRDGRQREDYWGEVHFSDLPKSFDGSYGAKARIARRWMNAFQSGLADLARFTVLAVDRHSPAHDPKRFPKDYHAYNRFTAMALKAGIAWFLGPENLDGVEITFISDAKDRMSRPDQGWIDNFEDYLPFRAELDALLGKSEGKPYPAVKLHLRLEDSTNNDLLQFCDLLLGATQQAMVGSSSRPVKRDLGRMVAHWYQDLQQPPWKQQFRLHRRFNLWAFPDKEGKPYNRVALALQTGDRQPSLF